MNINSTGTKAHIDNTSTTAVPSLQSIYNPPRHRGEVGWICPVCGRGLAPSTSYCPCNLTRNITYLNCGPTIQDTLDCAIGIKSTPPDAYYTGTTITSKTNCADGVYTANDSALTSTFDSKGTVFGKSTYTN